MYDPRDMFPHAPSRRQPEVAPEASKVTVEGSERLLARTGKAVAALMAICGGLGALLGLLLGWWGTIWDAATMPSRNAEAIAALQAETAAVDEKVDRVLDGIETLSVTVGTVRDDLRDEVRLRASADETVVVWATEAVLARNANLRCRQGATCRIMLRARRTPSGATCKVVSATPVWTQNAVAIPEEEIPSVWGGDFTPINLTMEFQWLPVSVVVPDDLPLGREWFAAVTLYAECPFAGEGQVIERRSMSVPVEIVEGPT